MFVGSQGTFEGNLGSQLGEFGGGTGVWGALGALWVCLCWIVGSLGVFWGPGEVPKEYLGPRGVFWGDSPMMELGLPSLPKGTDPGGCWGPSGLLRGVFGSTHR